MFSTRTETLYRPRTANRPCYTETATAMAKRVMARMKTEQRILFIRNGDDNPLIKIKPALLIGTL